MDRARLAAGALQLPLEQMLANMLDASLPHVTDAPVELQADLARMTWLDDQSLWAIARGEMSGEQQEQLRRLAEEQHQRSLNGQEQRLLEYLRREYGRSTLRKARAFALLSLRSGHPLLAAD